jgi:uncharacterized membrane protein
MMMVVMVMVVGLFLLSNNLWLVAGMSSGDGSCEFAVAALVVVAFWLVPRNQLAIDLHLLGSSPRIITIITIITIVVVVVANPLHQYYRALPVSALVLHLWVSICIVCWISETKKWARKRERERERGQLKRGLRQEQSLELNWVAHRVIVEEQFWFSEDTICWISLEKCRPRERERKRERERERERESFIGLCSFLGFG